MFKLPFISRSKELSDTFLTVDVGSQTVKCLAYVHENGQDEHGQLNSKLKTVGIAKEWLEPWSVRSGSIVEIDNVVETLDNAIFRSTEGLEKDVNDVIFGVSGDICICLVTTARVHRKHQKEISDKEIKNIETKIIAPATVQAQQMHAKKTGEFEPELELITTSTVYTKIDDEIKHNIKGTNGSKIEVALFTAFVPKYYIESLEDVAAMLNLNIMAVTSNLYALAESLKYGKKDPDMDSIIIDIGSDTTDVAVMFGGGIVASKSLNLGGNQFTKNISNEIGLNFAEAEKKKYDYTFNKMQDNEKVRIEDILGDVTDVWLSGLELLFNEFEGIKTFASDIYLTGGGSKLPQILEGLENSPWTKSIPFKEPPEFSIITAQDFKHVYDITGEMEHSEYVVPLALSIIYLEMNQNNND